MSRDSKSEEPIFAQAPPEARAEALQQDVEEIRDDLTGLVNELDRRRHDFFDVKQQMSRHALPLVLSALGLVGLVAGGLALAARRRRRRATIASRVVRLRQALARMIDKPQRVASSPSALEKIGVAGATTAISVLAKRLRVGATRSTAATPDRRPATQW
jgi:hypothetical protein